MNDLENFEYNNEEEAEIAQILSIQMHMKAVAEVRARIKTGPSLEFCEDCGDDIPEARRKAVSGCTLCVDCQTIHERKK
jgi:phage/conjugal plasmid C-4 type zinc finger TraR family protein